MPRGSRIQIGPLSRIFEFVVCCIEIGFNEGGIVYCRREALFYNPVINLRSTECLALRSVSICRDSWAKCLYLTLILLTWRIWWAPNNASRWQMGFNSAFKGLTILYVSSFKINYHLLVWTHIFVARHKIHKLSSKLTAVQLCFVF